MDWYDPLVELSSLSEFLSIKASAILFKERASRGVFLSSAHTRIRSSLYTGLPHLLRSALKVFHLFSGLLLLMPPELISSRSAHEISLQSFLL